MQVGLGKVVEIISETSRRFNDSNNFLIGPAGDQIDQILAHLNKRYRVNVIAMNLRPRNFMVLSVHPVPA